MDSVSFQNLILFILKVQQNKLDSIYYLDPVSVSKTYHKPAFSNRWYCCGTCRMFSLEAWKIMCYRLIPHCVFIGCSPVYKCMKKPLPAGVTCPIWNLYYYVHLKDKQFVCLMYLLWQLYLLCIFGRKTVWILGMSLSSNIATHLISMGTIIGLVIIIAIQELKGYNMKKCGRYWLLSDGCHAHGDVLRQI